MLTKLTLFLKELLSLLLQGGAGGHEEDIISIECSAKVNPPASDGVGVELPYIEGQNKVECGECVTKYYEVGGCMKRDNFCTTVRRLLGMIVSDRKDVYESEQDVIRPSVLDVRENLDSDKLDVNPTNPATTREGELQLNPILHVTEEGGQDVRMDVKTEVNPTPTTTDTGTGGDKVIVNPTINPIVTGGWR